MAKTAKSSSVVSLLRTSDPTCRQHLQHLFRRGEAASEQVERSVRDIIGAVKRHGDRAVCKYTREFDHVRVTPLTLAVNKAEMEAALTQLSQTERTALRQHRGSGDADQRQHRHHGHQYPVGQHQRNPAQRRDAKQLPAFAQPVSAA